MNAGAGASLIGVTGLGLRLARRKVLDVERIVIERGQVSILTGPNGAGKTTLLKVLAGLLQANEGHFECLGSAMAPAAAARFCRGRHIYLHQTPYLFDGTVADNIAYGLKQRGRDAAERRIEIRDALAWAGLEHLGARSARELSAGERQRVALTRARILNPALLLLDEITANMDTASRRRTYSLIADLREGGSSVVFATHAGDDVDITIDARLEMAEGRLRSPRTGAAVIPLRRDGSSDPAHS